VALSLLVLVPVKFLKLKHTQWLWIARKLRRKIQTSACAKQLNSAAINKPRCRHLSRGETQVQEFVSLLQARPPTVNERPVVSRTFKP
jgi:hypothetical protein